MSKTNGMGTVSLPPKPAEADLLMNKMVQNLIFSRMGLMQNWIDSQRDINKECGYPNPGCILPNDYWQMYEREGIATRVVDVYPEESWSEDPDIYEAEETDETDFDKAWDELCDKQHVYTHLQNLDKLSGIGRFGVMMLGTDDAVVEGASTTGSGIDPIPKTPQGSDPQIDKGRLATPLPGLDVAGQKVGGSKPLKLLFMREFDERLVTIAEYEKDLTNPRYGQPIMYNIRFVDVVTASGAQGTLETVAAVHWTRIIHVADNIVSNDVIGKPRMEKVYNRLVDIRKIMGGGGEMFWKGGFPGLSLEVPPNLEQFIEIDKDGLRKEVEAYQNGMTRYLALSGLTAKSLEPNIADPTAHLDVNINYICIALGVPKRVFMGSERGELASTQDARAWNRKLNRRQQDHVEPKLVRPFVDRCIAVGILPEPKEYHVDWPDLNSPSDTERADVANKETIALARYVSGGVDAIIPPFQYLTHILGWDDEKAQAVIDAAQEQIKSTEQPLARAQMAGDLSGVDPNDPNNVPSSGKSAGNTTPGSISTRQPKTGRAGAAASNPQPPKNKIV